MSPPVMWFKMEKYDDIGPRYMEVMKSLVSTVCDRNEEGIYFNVLFTDGSCGYANKLLKKDEVLQSLNAIETIMNATITNNF